MDDLALVDWLRNEGRARNRHKGFGGNNVEKHKCEQAADRILALSERIAVLEGLISEKSIERLAEDIAVAVTDPLHVTETRHSAMVRLGERLRNPLPADLRASLIGEQGDDIRT